ncbi:sensor histidine kinase [Streptomyces sp. NPDC102274]|uniref:sensor histidine kinase n=1 Tax=Streptomyces sp. NPDC102274 TaxID=3366151 RepID=UPI003810CEDE
MGTSLHRTNVHKATVYTRWMLCSMPWLLLASLLWPLLAQLQRGGAPTSAVGLAAALTTIQGIGATTAVAYGIGRHVLPIPLLLGIAALTVVQLALMPYLYDSEWLTGTQSIATLSVVLALPLAFALSPTADLRLYAGAALAETAAAAIVSLSLDPRMALPVVTVTATGWAVIGLLMHSSVWFLAVMWQLDAARESQARLVVAEERLRFARDLHDVIGRNLSVIALKGELAARLTQHPKAQAEMVEVQRLARELHKEIRDVVRNYRTTDLEAELDGARAVLEAAGTTCVIQHAPPAGGFGEKTQIALGWAVREAVTNVLRHSHATHCTITVDRSDGAGTQLQVTNDGATPGSGSGQGTGLDGLTQRLTPLGGDLCHGFGPKNTYRLTVHIPNGES